MTRHGTAFAKQIRLGLNSFYMTEPQHEMKYFYLFMLLVTSMTRLEAQYGLSGQFISGKVTSSIMTGQQSGSAQGFNTGVNYWLRLRNIRIEFFPELSYGVLKTSQIEGLPDLSLQKWTFTIPASFYLLELKGDCHCPTFSKQNDLVKKGLFVQLIGAIQNERSKSATVPLSGWYQNLAAGVGVGLDVGISDFLTLTPLAQYLNMVTSTKTRDTAGTKSEIRVGIRLTFRPDYR